MEAENRVGETLIRGDEMNANKSDLGKISSMINDLSRGHFQESEIIDTSYPAEAQVSK